MNEEENESCCFILLINNKIKENYWDFFEIKKKNLRKCF